MRRDGAEPSDSRAVVEGAAFNSSKGKGIVHQFHYIGDGADQQCSEGLHQKVGRVVRGPHHSAGGLEHIVLRNRGM